MRPHAWLTPERGITFRPQVRPCEILLVRLLVALDSYTYHDELMGHSVVRDPCIALHIIFLIQTCAGTASCYDPSSAHTTCLVHEYES